MTFTLRHRIAVLYLGATGLLFGVLAVVMYVAVQQAVFNELDGDLDLEAVEVQKGILVLDGEFIFANQPEWTEPEHGQVEVNPRFLQIVDTAGRIVRKSPNLRDASLTVAAGSDPWLHVNTALEQKPVRQVQFPIRDSGGRIAGTAIIALPRAEAENVLGALRAVLLVACPIALAALFLVGRFIAVRSIAPIERVILTAERITSENLDERIPLPMRQDELHRLTVTINQLLDRIRDAMLRERQFTADASHELRTPLASLKGTLEVLIRKPRSPEHYVEKVTACIGEVDRLETLINQLLLLARLDAEAAAPVRVKVQLDDVVSDVLRRLEPMRVTRHIAVSVQHAGGNVVTADAVMLDAMIGNIVSNAVKYSPDGGQVEVSITPDAGGTLLTVRDHGIGIRAEHVSRVFDRFYRADESRASRVHGTGLGLSIVKRLADLQGLDVGIDSTHGSGTVVTLRFPDASAHNTVAGAAV